MRASDKVEDMEIGGRCSTFGGSHSGLGADPIHWEAPLVTGAPLQHRPVRRHSRQAHPLCTSINSYAHPSVPRTSHARAGRQEASGDEPGQGAWPRAPQGAGDTATHSSCTPSKCKPSSQTSLSLSRTLGFSSARHVRCDRALPNQRGRFKMLLCVLKRIDGAFNCIKGLAPTQGGWPAPPHAMHEKGPE